MRIALARISEELGIERHSIRLVDGVYNLVIANRVSSKDDSIRAEIFRSAYKAKEMSVDDRHDIVLEIKRILGV